MKDLALHILDIAQNSIVARASLIKIEVSEDLKNDLLTISIEDNGSGMTSDQLRQVADPYYTSRTTRKVGLGIPLLKHNAKQSGGNMMISSGPGVGTAITAVFIHSHIDRPPIGDVSGVLKILIGANPDLDFIYKHIKGDKEYILDSREIKKVLEGVPVSHPEVLNYISEMMYENLKEMNAV